MGLLGLGEDKVFFPVLGEIDFSAHPAQSVLSCAFSEDDQIIPPCTQRYPIGTVGAAVLARDEVLLPLSK